ncbi:prepilin-type N-terminal cleavage/methylation domain-containing protein [Paenisporosarcina sp. TG20]|uniref:prepilin-type N-terminal cleavage/methylation domain-containing protein n=1 Tax=Paenisporosarcina sp. TG20 TaxID=1211706 RepID=UPI0003000109|nr:prepilin-type N-terminal cleavage/methylation domain-containing protein [Paenisporosarcina sp. TG20]
MNLNEKGLTLLEVLASLVLVSLVVALAMTTFNIGVKYNVIETTKTKMQQESNLIVSTLMNVHRTEKCYDIQNVTTITIDVYDDALCTALNRKIEFSQSQFNYEVNLQTGTPEKINPQETNYSMTLTIKDVNSSLVNKYQTQIYRLNTTY